MPDDGHFHGALSQMRPPLRLQGMMEAVAAVPPFERFYVEHRDVVLGFLRRRLGRQAAEDAFQETFLRALRAYDRLEHGEHLRAWVLTIAARLVIDSARRTKPTASELPELPVEDGRPAYAEIEHLADGLPPTERAAVVLRYAYDLPYDDIADALGSTPEAARQAASSGVRRLRSREEDRMSITDNEFPADLDRRFREAAAAEHLLDVGFDVLDTPIGPLLVAATDRGLSRIFFDARARAAPRPARPRRSGRACSARPRPSTHAHRQLDEYFEGTAHAFALDVDLRGDRTVRPAGAGRARPRSLRATRRPTARSPAKVGAPRAARAVGTVMNRNPIPIVLPCHRVVGSNGSLSGYGGGLDVKEHLLRLEGALL